MSWAASSRTTSSTAGYQVLRLGHHNPAVARGRAAGKLPSRKGSGGAAQQPAECGPALCPGGQSGQWHPGLRQKQRGQRDQGSGCPLVVRLLQFGGLATRTASCRWGGPCWRPPSLYKQLNGGCSEVLVSSRVTSGGTREESLESCQGSFGWDIRENF